MRKILLALPALLVLAGCPSISTMGTARTLPEGKTQFFFATGGMALQDFSTDDAGNPETLAYPTFEFGARYGVTDGVEMGGKIWPLGAELGAKIQLVRSESESSGIDIALSPALSFYPTSEGSLGWAHLSLPVGVNVGGSQLILSPRVSDLVVFGSGEVGNVLWVGGSAGFAWKLGKGGFRILPEVAILSPVAVSVGTDISTDFAFDGALIQGSLGFLFGP